VLACGGGPSARAATAEPKLPAGSQLDRELRNGTVRFLKGQDLSRDLETDPTFKASRLGGDVEGVARAFLKHFSSLWRLDDPNAELVKRRIDVDRTGASHVRFEQAWQGIPIPGAELIVHLDRDRRVVLVSGAYLPTPRDLGTTPKLDAAEARAAAAKETDTAACDACATELVVFRGARLRSAARVARRAAEGLDPRRGDHRRREERLAPAPAAGDAERRTSEARRGQPMKGVLRAIGRGGEIVAIAALCAGVLVPPSVRADVPARARLVARATAPGFAPPASAAAVRTRSARAAFRRVDPRRCRARARARRGTACRHPAAARVASRSPTRRPARSTRSWPRRPGRSRSCCGPTPARRG
jgi:hypothetical protein